MHGSRGLSVDVEAAEHLIGDEHRRARRQHRERVDEVSLPARAAAECHLRGAWHRSWATRIEEREARGSRVKHAWSAR